MNLDELHEFLKREFEYPIAHASVIERIGTARIAAPDNRSTETVSTIIGSVDQPTYDSADELFETIIGNLGEEYIGRKFYDDRGGNPPETAPGPRDEANISF